MIRELLSASCFVSISGSQLSTLSSPPAQTSFSSFSILHSQFSILNPLKHFSKTIISRIAAAFTTVVTSFVSEILLPPLSLIPGINRNMDSKFAILRRGPNYNKTMSIGYNTLEQAAADGAVVMAYG